MLFVLVPARIFLFNLEAQVVLLTIPLLALVALGSGFLFDGFGGWCSGACPIRPVEMLYGQYNQERHRPEACQSCNNCQKECSRLYSSSNEVKINNMLPFQNQIFSFPGFILGYFLSSSTDSIAMVYLKCLGIALLSWLVIRVLFNGRKGVIISGILAIGVYYGFTVPSVVGVWDLPILTIPLLYGILIALFFWGIRGFITKTLAKTS
ncbi:MAG: hypothetical protein H6624_17645 [Bdellovibrionaceae bacterium]|nr:hypothetical protein [Bdellovibrionales bacterium]MCB9086169.1 hypothetical protein [Pseudobdellovibrionaceae bacterium]